MWYSSCEKSAFLAHFSQSNSCLFLMSEEQIESLNDNYSTKLVVIVQVKIPCLFFASYRFPGLIWTQHFLGKIQNGWQHKLLHKLLHKVKVFGQTPDPWWTSHIKKNLSWLTDSSALMMSGNSLRRQTARCDSSVPKTLSYCHALYCHTLF